MLSLQSIDRLFTKTFWILLRRSLYICGKQAGISPGLTIAYVFFSPTFLLMLISPKPLADKVLDYRLDTEASNSYFPQDIAEAIHQLWKDPIITKIMDEHSSEFYLMDSAA